MELDCESVHTFVCVRDMRNVYGRALSSTEIDALYAEHLAHVEVVQLEQMAMLRCLIRHHGLTAVFVEGMTEDNAALQAVLESIRTKVAFERQLRRQRKDAEAAMDRAGAKDVLAEIDDLLEQARREQLEVGAAIRLVASGELKEALPLDDERALKAADPIKNGRFSADAAKIDERRDAMVHNALRRPVAVIVLGGSHDLSENTERISGSSCAYVRVTTKGYPGD